MAAFIGIDCGKHTGFAVWDTISQSFWMVDTVPVHKALELVRKLDAFRAGQIKVYIEDARQRQWLPKDTSASAYRGHLMGAGSVKRDAVIWQDALTDWGIPFEMVPPRPGLTKWDAATFARVTGYKGRTSNHARDAALLVFGRR
jgi:hypothetical protein